MPDHGTAKSRVRRRLPQLRRAAEALDCSETGLEQAVASVLVWRPKVQVYVFGALPGIPRFLLHSRQTHHAPRRGTKARTVPTGCPGRLSSTLEFPISPAGAEDAQAALRARRGSRGSRGRCREVVQLRPRAARRVAKLMATGLSANDALLKARRCLPAYIDFCFLRRGA